MASPTWWAWVWASSGSRWWMGRPGVLRSMGSQRVRTQWLSNKREMRYPGDECSVLLWVKKQGNRLSWLHLDKEANSILHSPWTWDDVPGSHGNHTPNRPPRLIDTRFHTTRKTVTVPYVVNLLCNLKGTRWYTLPCRTIWSFWLLWIMAVTWWHLPLTFSRLGLRNLQM